MYSIRIHVDVWMIVCTMYIYHTIQQSKLNNLIYLFNDKVKAIQQRINLNFYYDFILFYYCY